MALQPPPPNRPSSSSGDRTQTVRVRRAPKYAVFLIAGAALGLIVALILTFAFNGTATESPNTGLVYSAGQVFGFLLLICGTAGVGIGAIVALLFDRASARRAREVVVDHESVRTDEA